MATVREEVGASLDETPTARMARLLDLAEELGWEVNPRTPGITLAIRMDRKDERQEGETLRQLIDRGAALPFYAIWQLVVDPETGKRTWRFDGAKAANMQKLSWNDIPAYLKDPTVIYPQDPQGSGTLDDDELAADYAAWMKGSEDVRPG